MSAPQDLSKGDTVSWNYGSGQPEGKVEAVHEEKTTIESKNGNPITKTGTEEDVRARFSARSLMPVARCGDQARLGQPCHQAVPRAERGAWSQLAALIGAGRHQGQGLIQEGQQEGREGGGA